MDEKLSPEETSAFREMAAGFAKKSIAPMLEHESPDRDLSLLPKIFEQAVETGLLASPKDDAPGRETGVWGAKTLKYGPEVSAMLLEELATVCGGTAMCFHAQGIGALPLLRAENPPASPPEKVAFAFSESFGVPSLATLRKPDQAEPASVETVAKDAAGGYELNGEKFFVYGISSPESYIVFARMAGKGEWGCFLVHADSEGLQAVDAGHRTGLRACGLEHLKLDGVKVSGDNILRFSAPTHVVVLDQLCLNMIGLSAIATGIARGAIASAKEYAAERYQGGAQIIDHPAIKMLLADSDARVAACQAGVARAANAEGDAEARFREAVRMKLFVMQAAAGAVTDCLQVFGGYGYMEDYPMEKRLRDVSVLKSAGGAPRELRMILADMIKEG